MVKQSNVFIRPRSANYYVKVICFQLFQLIRLRQIENNPDDF